MKKLLHGRRFLLALLMSLCVTIVSAGQADLLKDTATLDQDTQLLKKAVLDLNKDLFLLEEELLYPSNTQVAVFVSMDVGQYFALDSIQLTLDGKDVSNYLYTAREVEALHRGGVQQLYLGNLKTGEHELVAIFTGKGPHERDYKRGATLNFSKKFKTQKLPFVLPQSLVAYPFQIMVLPKYFLLYLL